LIKRMGTADFIAGPGASVVWLGPNRAPIELPAGTSLLSPGQLRLRTSKAPLRRVQQQIQNSASLVFQPLTSALGDTRYSPSRPKATKPQRGSTRRRTLAAKARPRRRGREAQFRPEE